MKQEGVMPDRVLFLSILNAIASPGALQIGRQIHAQVIEAGLESDLPVANALISMYAKCGSMEDAHRIFDSMPQRNVVSWTAMISGYAQQNHSKAAIEVFSQMQREGVKPDRVTFISILDACANLAALQKGKSIHAQILKAGLDSDNGVEIALVNMYAKCGSLVHADQVFDKMLQRDVVVWTVMIVGYAQHGRGKEAIQLFEWMKREGVKPDSLTFTGLLTACSHVGLVEEGRCYFQSITQDYGITPAMQHYGSMVDLLGRAGRLDEAADFIEKMPFEADASVWGALLGACKIHCNVELAECAAKRLLVLDPDNGSWYLLLSNIYAAAGMSDKAQYMRKFMKKEGAMKDPGPSWVEVDNEVHLFVAEDRSHQYRGERNEIGHADEKDERERIYIS
jgi:pentatricopeptide repeat protein